MRALWDSLRERRCLPNCSFLVCGFVSCQQHIYFSCLLTMYLQTNEQTKNIQKQRHICLCCRLYYFKRRMYIYHELNTRREIKRRVWYYPISVVNKAFSGLTGSPCCLSCREKRALAWKHLGSRSLEAAPAPGLPVRLKALRASPRPCLPPP